jgi:hypothetical protein
MSIIKQLELTVNTDLIQQDLDKILTYTTWGSHNQIGLNHRPGADNIWFDNIGSLFNRETRTRLANEHDFTQWSPDFPTYIKTAIDLLEKAENFRVGRVRFMRCMPKCGLSYHVDESIRYHLVIATNPSAFFIGAVEGKDEIAHCFHLPRDNYFYKVDTTVLHTVYNAGNDPRIHLVIC